MSLKENIHEIINDIGNRPDRLIEVLLKVQKETEGQYISEEALKIISRALDVPLSKVYGVATFYAMFSMKKRGKYIIQICNSGPCYVNGGQRIAQIFQQVLGIKMGETTKDGLFTLEYTSCIGACDHAPAASINGEQYGPLDETKIIHLINAIKKGGSIDG